VIFVGGNGWRLPGYRIEELLGGGATSEVWRARVRATGLPVALKRIRLTDPEQRAAAVSEAAVLGALDHPNLIRLHRLERIEGAIVLVLDYASAGSLAALLGARGRLTPGEVVTALSPIAAALAHAHAAGIVHGDVTPANVLFTDIGLPLLADLGVARLVGDTKPVHTTLPYADPIVIAGYLPEAASDVFMLGAVTMHAVTGHAPPAAVGEVDPAAWQAKLGARLAKSDVPGPMAAVIGRAMSLEPHLRGSAAEFALDLRHAATPVALEVSAGRSRVEPSLARLAAIAAGRPADPAAAATPVPDAPRVSDAAPITRGARLPSPMPPARHRARGRSLAVPAAILLVAAAIVAAAVWWPRTASRSPVAAPPPSRSSRVEATPSAGPLDAAGAERVLTRLDALRSRALAARDPQPLAEVYSSGALLARDQALVGALVPPGCGLRGVRTAYRDLRIASASRTSLTLTVTASLRRSTLVCGGTAAGHAAGRQPTRLALTLTRSAAGWRIAELHPTAG
jgi:eukaryotic-like serine/threonine-protein kinase